MSNSLLANVKNKISDHISNKISDTFTYVTSTGPINLNKIINKLGLTQNGPIDTNDVHYQGFIGTTGTTDPTNIKGLTGIGPTNIGPTGIGPTGIGPTDIGPTGIGPTGIGPTGIGLTGIGPTGIGPTGTLKCGTGFIEYTYINNNITYTGCTGISPPEINAKNIAIKTFDTIGNIFYFILYNGIYILIALFIIIFIVLFIISFIVFSIICICI